MPDTTVGGQVGLVAVADGDGGALFGEQFGDAAANPARPARHDCDTAAQGEFVRRLVHSRG